MNPKSKKELAEQGSSVVQAVKWIGGAIFGDADDVLDDMAEQSERAERTRRRNALPPRPPAAPPRPARRPQPPPPPKVIDVEAFLEDEDEDE
jgi:hypothetical protein